MSTFYLDKNHELLEACKMGDSRAQQKLYSLYAKAMLNTGYRILNDIAEAEDVLQEVFLDAFQALIQFRHESSFGAWLKRIMINKSLSRLRLLRNGIEKIDPAEAFDIPEEVQLDEHDILWKVQEVRKTIQELPDGYRLVISLYLLEGFDHEEIAGILNIAEPTSRTQYLRGKRRLLEMLKKKGIEAYER